MTPEDLELLAERERSVDDLLVHDEDGRLRAAEDLIMADLLDGDGERLRGGLL